MFSHGSHLLLKAKNRTAELKEEWRGWATYQESPEMTVIMTDIMVYSAVGGELGTVWCTQKCLEIFLQC